MKCGRLIAWALCLCMLAGLSCCAAAEEAAGMIDVEYKEEDMDGSWEPEGTVGIVFDGERADIGGEGAHLADGVLTISEAGEYLLGGRFAGRIVVDAGKKDDVRLILNGLSVETEASAAIFILKADKATLTLAQGSENVLLSGMNLISEDDEELDAAVYSKADLVINGAGSLAVDSPAGHGILSKDDLRITGGSIAVDAGKDGLRGRDAVMIADGHISIVAGGDGVQSNNDEDEERGYMSVDGGELSVEAGEDGLQAETVLQLRGGTVSLVCGGGAGEPAQPAGMNGRWGLHTDKASDDGVSRKGLKAGSALFITGGLIHVDSLDDALHSDGNIAVSGGSLTLASGDDGVHAEGTLAVSGGSVAVTQSYEGMEALKVLISGGETSVVASDDGLNAAGGSDGDSDWRHTVSADALILISGGRLTVNAEGDGIDSNGGLRIEGGETMVSGPTHSGNGALDAAGSMSVSGGVLIASGAAGMADSPAADGQTATMIYPAQVQKGGVTVRIRTEADGELLSFTPEKDWSSVVISLPGIEEGEKIELYVGEEVIASGTAGSGSGRGGMGGKGHRK